MNKKLVITVLLAGLMSAAVADEFYLKHDKTGKLYGPYNTEDGSKVEIGKAVFTVVQKKPTLSKTEKKLDKIRIPQVEFRSARLEDAIQFLTDAVRMRDPEKTGVNFVIAKSPSSKKRPSDPNPFAFDDFGAESNAEPTVTLSMRDVSAIQVLKSLMDQTGYEYKASENTITIYKKSRKDES